MDGGGKRVSSQEPLIWLSIDENVSISVPLNKALEWTERDFERLYRKTILSSKRKEARAWAKEQIRRREEALRK